MQRARQSTLHRILRGLLLSILVLPFSSAMAFEWLDLWLTPDQQAQRLLQQGQYAAAAKKYTSAEDAGAALFLAGEFEQSAGVLGRTTSAVGYYNRGNALIMLGDYAAAIESYQNALLRKPDWIEAQQNLHLAQLRLEALAPPDDDGGGTGGKLGADEYVFDLDTEKNEASGEETLESDNAESSEAEMRATWLRKVETRPSDFLAARFNYQLYQQQSAAPEATPDE